MNSGYIFQSGQTFCVMLTWKLLLRKCWTVWLVPWQVCYRVPASANVNPKALVLYKGDMASGRSPESSLSMYIHLDNLQHIYLKLHSVLLRESVYCLLFSLGLLSLLHPWAGGEGVNVPLGRLRTSWHLSSTSCMAFCLSVIFKLS